MCWATAVLKLFRDVDSTIVFGSLFQNGIVLGKKLDLKDCVLHLKGRKE